MLKPVISAKKNPFPIMKKPKKKESKKKISFQLCFFVLVTSLTLETPSTSCLPRKNANDAKTQKEPSHFSPLNCSMT